MKKSFLNKYLIPIIALAVVSFGTAKLADAYIYNPTGTTTSGTVTSITAGNGLAGSPNPIVGAGTISLDLTNPNTWTGQQIFNSTTPTGVTNLETTLYADQFAGADMGAKINAAGAACPAAGCIVKVPAGSFNYSTDIVQNTVNQRILLECSPGGATVLNYTGSGTGITINNGSGNVGAGIQAGGYGVQNCTFNGPSGAGTTVGIFLGGTNGAQGVTVTGNTFKHFGTGMQTGANTWATEIANNNFYANDKNLVVNAASNSGENMRFTDDTFNDSLNTGGAGDPTNCVILNGTSTNSIDFLNSSFDDCQLVIGTQNLQVTVTGGHFENPVGDVKPAYDFIVQSDDSFASHSAFTATGVQFFNGANASAPAEFIKAGSDVRLYGDTFTGGNSAAPAGNIVTTDSTGSVEMYGVVCNASGANFLVNGTGPTCADAAHGFDTLVSKLNSSPFSMNQSQSGQVSILNGGNLLFTVAGTSLNLGTAQGPSSDTAGLFRRDNTGQNLFEIYSSGLTSSSAVQKGLNINPAINQSGTGGYVGLFVDPTETATGSGTKNLIEAKVGAGSDLFTVDHLGNTTIAGTTTLATSLSGLLKATSGVVSTATSGTDYAPATSGTSLLYGNGAGGFSNATTGTGISFSGGVLSATGSGGTVTSVATDSSLTGGTITTTGTLGINLTNPNTWTGAQTVSTSPFTISGNQSASAWTTNGIQLKVAAATLTDTSSSGTVAVNAANSFLTPTFAASSSTTYTVGTNVYISNAPSNGSNVTQSNSYALYVAAGPSAFLGGISTAGANTQSNFFAVGGAIPGSTGQSPAQFGGSSTVGLRALFNGVTTGTLATGVNYANVIVASSPITTFSSGTHSWLSNFVINPIGTITSGGATVTNTATAYIGAASAGVGSSNNYALYVNGPVASNATQTTVNCSTSGTVVFSEPFDGPSYKQVVAHENACLGTASYTFPRPFTNTPDSLGANAAKHTAISTTATTITGTTTTGFSQLYGY